MAHLTNLLTVNDAASHAPRSASTEPMVEEPDGTHTSSYTPSSSHKATKPPDAWFSFDDINPSSWLSKMYEFNAWIDNRMMTPGTLLEDFLRDFTSRFTRFS